MKKLTSAKLNKEYIVANIEGGQGLRKRLFSMGFNVGATIKLLKASGNGPASVLVAGSKVALGNGMVDKIIVKEKKLVRKKITVAIAGNPNAGKTTIFNNLTGARQHVGNYPGVTVEKKEGVCNFEDYSLNFVDLPGTYSLSAYSMEEIVTRDFIVDERPDVVVNIIDASNLERNLYLAIQLLELKVPLVLIFNMSDVAKLKGIDINIKYLSNLLGVPIVEAIGNKNKGSKEILKTIVDLKEGRINLKEFKFDYGKEVEDEVEKIVNTIKDIKELKHPYEKQWMALKLLERDKEVTDMLSDANLNKHVEKSIKHIESIYGEPPETLIADQRYGIISGACTESVVQTIQSRHDVSDTIDKVLTNRVLGIPIFLAVMWLMFKWTFVLAEHPKMWIENFFVWLGDSITAFMPAGLLQSLIVDGIIGGVGGVLVFLPNILLLFLFIAFLEDTGYMSRAAFVIDKVMHKVGLHGKSFIPMLIGFGCTVPAYMGSRILEDKTDRLITMHINTFMSCGARLPVYVLLCGIFWPDKAGNMMFLIYIIGIILGLIVAKILRMTRFKGMSAPFVMELPIYRMPTIKGLLIHMWDKGVLYVKKAGTVILCVSILIWALMTFPRVDSQTITKDPIEYTYAGKVGHFIEPVIKPLGFDWKIGLSLFAGLMAKELVVSTLGTVYSVGEAEQQGQSLKERIKNDPNFTPLTAMALMIFVLVYFPCLAAMVVFYKETKSVKETLFQIFYTTGLAWLLAFIVYQGGMLLKL